MKARIARKIIKRNLFSRWSIQVADTRNGVFRLLSDGCIDLNSTNHWKRSIIQQLKKQGNLDGNPLFKHIMMPTGKMINTWDL